MPHNSLVGTSVQAVPAPAAGSCPVFHASLLIPQSHAGTAVFFQETSEGGWKANTLAYFLPEDILRLNQAPPAYQTTWTQMQQQGHNDSWTGSSHWKGQMDGAGTGWSRPASKCPTTSVPVISRKCSVFLLICKSLQGINYAN